VVSRSETSQLNAATTSTIIARKELTPTNCPAISAKGWTEINKNHTITRIPHKTSLEASPRDLKTPESAKRYQYRLIEVNTITQQAIRSQ
jgi:hypothetical protein